MRVQFDGIFNGQSLDMNWNSVWQSEITKNNKGWFIEMKIPYSAIRFPSKNIQEWENKGGIGIHHTDVGKTINELKRLGFK